MGVAQIYHNFNRKLIRYVSDNLIDMRLGNIFTYVKD